jgi:hypothetical protein
MLPVTTPELAYVAHPRDDQSALLVSLVSAAAAAAAAAASFLLRGFFSHSGSQTGWLRPSTFCMVRRLGGWWAPQKKQDMVFVAPENAPGRGENGEPGALLV